MIIRDIARQIALLPVETTRSEVNASNNSVLLSDENIARIEIILINNSKKKAYISYGTPATKDDIPLDSKASMTITNVKANIYAIWDNGSDKEMIMFETVAL